MRVWYQKQRDVETERDVRCSGKLGGAEMSDRDDGRKDKRPLGELSEEHRERQAQDDGDLGLEDERHHSIHLW